jgi:hypothetical protein
VLTWLEWKHPCSQELDTRAAVYGALERFESIDLAFRLTAAPRLRDGVPLGLDVTHQFCLVIFKRRAVGVARAARDWLLAFLHERKPTSLGAAGRLGSSWST